MSAKDRLQARVTAYNEALDTIYCEDATADEKQAARNETDRLFQSFDTARMGICGCGHPLHLRLDCPKHGKKKGAE